MIRKFLRVLRPRDAELHADRWRDDLGQSLVDALRRERVLYDAGRASWYRCGGRCGEQRQVIHAPGEHPGKPYLALCAIDNGCFDVPLAEDDLNLIGFSFADAVAAIARVLGISQGAESEEVFPGVFAIGTVQRAGARSDVFLAINPDDDTLPLFVSARAHAQREAVVLLNTSRWLSQAFIDAHGPGVRVELALLEDLLAVVDGAIVAPRGPLSRTVAARAAPHAAPHVAVLLSHEGSRRLTHDEYVALDEGASGHFDLYLDLAALRRVGRRKFFRGGTRVDGRFHDTELTENEARGVAEFIERARDGALSPAKLASLKGVSAEQLFKTGWPKVDRRREFIVTTTDGARFQPPPGKRWALVRPANATTG